MTGSRKKLWLSLFWGGLFLLMVGSGALLYFSLQRFLRESGKLSEVKANLEALYKMAPFPSPSNVEMEKKNLATLQTSLADLQSSLAKNQVEPAELKQPTVFMESFWQTQKDLISHAKSTGVALPADFGFGLDAYLKGMPPKPDHVPRLMQQLTVIKSLCDVLFAAKVSAIDAVGREEFEGDEESGSDAGGGSGSSAPASGRRTRRGGGDAAATDMRLNVSIENPQAGMMEPGALFSKMRFVLVFKGKEESVLKALNYLAAHEMFIVVNRVTWNAPRDQVTIRKRVIGQEAAVGAGLAPAESGKESRVVSGRESTLTVRLDLDVYRFTRKTES